MAIKGLQEIAEDPRFWKFTPEQQEAAMAGIYGDKWGKFNQDQKNEILDYMANTWGPPRAKPRVDVMGKVKEGIHYFVEEPSAALGVAGGFAKRAKGAGLGGVIGETAEIVNESLTGQQKPVETPLGTITPPTVGDKNLLQATAAQAGYVGKRVLRAGFIEAVADKAGEVIATLAKGGFRAASADPFKRIAAEEAQVINQFWSAQGGHLPVAALYPEDAYAMQTAHKFAVGSFTGGGASARSFKVNVLTEAGTMDDYLKMLSDAAGEFGDMDVKEAGALITDLITGGRKVSAAMEKELFGVVDELNQKGVTVSLGDFQQVLRKDTAHYSRMNQKLAGDLKRFKDGIDKTVQQLGSPQDVGTGVLDYEASFSEAQFLRSRLLAIKEGVLATKDGDAIRLVNKWIAGLDQAMEAAGTKLDPTAFRAFRKANRFVVKNKEAFYNDTADKLLNVTNRSPGALEKVAADAFKLNDANAVRNLRRLTRRSARMQRIDPNEAWRGMQSQYMMELFDQFSIEPIPQAQVTQKIGKQVKLGDKGLLRSADLLKFINDRHTKPVFDEIFKNSPVTRNNFIRFLQACKLYKTHAAGGAMMVIQLAQGGAVAALPSGTFKVREVVPLFLTPWAISKGMHSPGMTKWLIEGMKTPANSGRAMVVASRLAYHTAMADVPLITPTEPPDPSLGAFNLGEITLME